MMETALSARHYTAKHIQPLLMGTFRDPGKFHPESVPAFAATELFLRLKDANPTYADYSYKGSGLESD